MTTYLLSLVLLSALSACLTVARTISEDRHVIKVSSGSDATLPCRATHKPEVQYVAVSWYKHRGIPSLKRHGLVRRDLPDGAAMPYLGVSREVVLLDESREILLPNVTCNDSGLYLCDLAAPVGEQNQEGRVHLILTDCPIQVTSFPVDSEDFDFRPTENQMRDNLVLFASAMLMVAFFMSLIGYCCVKNTFRDRSQKTPIKEILLDAPVKPLEKKDLQLIYTLGPKTSTLKHVFI
ncbi:CD83 antigen [Cololabis saira]|uniref:CD83 antigen n=1 Tax=Cololabis saira TaxID=129043 RepID=UPI002AD1E8A6|nr:CD83 antigen [Cololabis saira]